MYFLRVKNFFCAVIFSERKKIVNCFFSNIANQCGSGGHRQVTSVNSMRSLLSASFYLSCVFVPCRFPNPFELNNWYQSEVRVLVRAIGSKEGKSKN